MYARVQLTVATKPQALTVPVNAVVDHRGQARRVPGQGRHRGGRAKEADFVPIETGLEDGTRVEVARRR